MDLPEEGPAARCDRERVAQIVRILLDNALRHTPEGTDVTVRANRENGAAEVTVADTGPGLPVGAGAKVFERFYTGDAARGAGLGLAIARELAERMDGRLVLSSERGKTQLHAPPSDGLVGAPMRARTPAARAAVCSAPRALAAAPGCDGDDDSGQGSPQGHDHARAGGRRPRARRRLRPRADL